MIEVLSILIFVLVVMIPTYKYEYVTDDFMTKSNSGAIPKNKLIMLWKQFRSYGYWDHVSAHIMTTLVHASVCIAMHYAFGRSEISYMAAIIFAVLGSNNQGAIWLSGRHYAVSTLLVLLGFCLPWIAPIFYIPKVLGFVSHNCIFAPLMFITTKYWWLSLLTPIILYTSHKAIFKVRKEHYAGNKHTIPFHPRKILWFFKFYGYYATQAFIGRKIGFFHEYMSNFISSDKKLKESERIDGYFFVGLILFFTTLILIPEAFKINYGFAWGLLWFTINIAMWTNVINTMQEHISLRYAYMANVGVCLALANLFSLYPEWVVGGFVLWQLAQLYRVMPMYKNVFWFNYYGIINEPNYSYSWILHGNFHFNRGNFMEAIRCWNEAKSKNPDDIRAFYNTSAACICLQQLGQAKTELDMSQDIQCFGQEKERDLAYRDRRELIDMIEKGLIKTLETSQIPLAI